MALSHAEIRSPINGRTGTIQLHAGNMVKANADSSMVVITRWSPSTCVLPCPKAHLSAIGRAGDSPCAFRPKQAVWPEPYPATCPLSTQQRGREDRDHRPQGPLRQHGPEVVAGPVRRRNPGGRRCADVVLVPERAVSPGADGEYVYIILPEGTVEYRPVKTGLRHDGQVVVETGLRGGKSCARRPPAAVPGAAVTIREPAAAGQPSAQEGAQRSRAMNIAALFIRRPVSTTWSCWPSCSSGS